MATVAELEDQLAEAYECRSAILKGQEKTARGKTLRYPDLKTVNETIRQLESQIAVAQQSSRPTHTYIKRVRC